MSSIVLAAMTLAALLSVGRTDCYAFAEPVSDCSELTADAETDDVDGSEGILHECHLSANSFSCSTADELSGPRAPMLLPRSTSSRAPPACIV